METTDEKQKFKLAQGWARVNEKEQLYFNNKLNQYSFGPVVDAKTFKNVVKQLGLSCQVSENQDEKRGSTKADSDEEMQMKLDVGDLEQKIWAQDSNLSYFLTLKKLNEFKGINN